MDIVQPYGRRIIVAAFLWFFSLLIIAVPTRADTPPPALELVDVYQGLADLSHYWVSEKFDGVRGYWDGHQLLTRSGNEIAVPAWFTRHWPATPMDGELWAGYGRFTVISSLVRSADDTDPRWRQIRYQVFDLPAHPGDFDARVPAIKKVVAAIDDPWVLVVRQFHVDSQHQLKLALKRVLDRQGEGLVLHRGNALYRAGRHVGLLKVKPYHDAEARVLAIKPGQGRISGLMGSLWVETPDGRRFYVGSGFSDEQRANPPAIGSWITYRYTSLTVNGLPRFPRFLRLRPGGPPPG